MTEKKMLIRLRAERKKLEGEIETLYSRVAIAIGSLFILGVFLGRITR